VGSYLSASKPSDAASQGKYVLDRMTWYAAHYYARVAGRDTGLPPRQNGHDEFARAWVREMLTNLHGLPVRVFRQYFATPGFLHVRASLLGVNQILLIPGSRRPARAVVIAAHYDGEPFSQGSAYDDTSGSAVMLGSARVLGELWRRHGLPSMTVEFVLFDGEEQGLVGSGAYLFDLRHNAVLPKPVMMIDEEQSGVGYPARPFGLLGVTPMPAYATTTVQNRFLKEVYGRLTPPRPTDLALMRSRLMNAISQGFNQLSQVYGKVSFRGGSAKVFLPSDKTLVKVGPNPVCCSDNAPFEALGIPTETYSGDFLFYSKESKAWSYPFDQPQDTVANMACDTGGSPTPGKSLEAAMAIPIVLTRILVQDYAPAHRGSGIAVASTIVVNGIPARFTAVGPAGVKWIFGDGASAAGWSVTHRYRSAGTFGASARARGLVSRFRVTVLSVSPQFHNGIDVQNPPPVIRWHPSELSGIRGCP
jgi:Peptidase family M28